MKRRLKIARYFKILLKDFLELEIFAVVVKHMSLVFVSLTVQKIRNKTKSYKTMPEVVSKFKITQYISFTMSLKLHVSDRKTILNATFKRLTN